MNPPVQIFFFACFFGVLAFVQGSELQRFKGCVFEPTVWSDGDSFSVRFPDEQTRTIRLYGADTIELQINDSTAARRLRAQRRYFGISDFGRSPAASIGRAKALGEAAKRTVDKLLAKPFTVHTAFADGGGSAGNTRIYGFVTTASGEDLATVLVQKGLARAFGVYRSTPDGRHRDEYREALKDAELVAARRGQGAWAYTDWAKLPEERRAQRLEEQEEAISMGRVRLNGPINPNEASLAELQALPGIGPALARRIVEARPFQEKRDLLKVPGVGEKTLGQISDQLSL